MSSPFSSYINQKTITDKLFEDSQELRNASIEAIRAELEVIDPRYGYPEFMLSPKENLINRLLLQRLLIHGIDDDEVFSLEARLWIYNIFSKVYPPIQPELTRELFKNADYDYVIFVVRTHLVNELEGLSAPPTHSKRFQKKIEEVFKKFKTHSLRWASSAWNRTSSEARNIGVRASESLKNTMHLILDYISGVINQSYHFIVDFIKRNIDTLLTFIQDKMRSIWAYCTSSLTACACTFVGLILIILAFAIPQGALAWYARFMTAAFGALVIYCQNIYGAFMGAAFAHIMLHVRSHPLVVNYNTNQVNMKTQSEQFQKDLKSWLSSTVCALSLISMSVTGLEIPSDKKTLDEMLKRHALLGRAYQTWNVMSERIVAYIDESMRFVYKYVLKKEYVWFDHIPEVDKLYDDVTELCQIANASTIMRDQDKVDKIEAMYLQYMHLRRIYVSNKKITQVLDLLGPPLIHFYKEVCNRNPKGYVMRREPVCLMLKGGSGKGKTFVSNILAQSLLKICGKYDPDDDLSGKIYARAHEQVYWDGYVGQPIVIFDDFGQMVDSAANPNLEYHELIRGVNVFPFQLHSASLEMKGNNPFEADFVVLTTNLETVNPASLISSEAVNRRIHVTIDLDVIDEVKRSEAYGVLDLNKLRMYRESRFLTEDDTSHYIFIVNGTRMTYDQMVVYISKIYQSKLKTYNLQEKIAEKNKDAKLPNGCFSTDPRWIAQGDVSELPKTSTSFVDRTIRGFRSVDVPLPLFFNASIEIRRRILLHHKVVRVTNFPSALDNRVFNTYEELIGFVEVSHICLAYCSHPEAKVCKQHILKHLTLTRERVVFDYMNRQLLERWYEKQEEEFRYTHPEPGDARAFWIKYLQRMRMIVSNEYDWFTSADSRYEKFWFALGFVVIAATTCLLMFSIYNVIASLFPESHTKYSLLRLLKWHRMLELATVFAGPFALEHPAIVNGFVSFGAFAFNFIQHYFTHPEYEKSCPECTLHKTVHSMFQYEDLQTCKDISVSVEDLKKLEELFSPEDDPSHGKQNSRVRARVNYESDSADEVKVEGDTSPNKGSARTRQRVKLESDTSPNKTSARTRQRVKLESDTTPSGNNLAAMFPGLTMHAEGVSSQQAIELAAKLRRNMIHLSVEFDGEKHSIGTIVALKGRAAIINYHYFQTISVFWEHAQEKDSFKCLLRQHEFETGHYCHLQDIVATAKTINRGGVLTEFYLFELPQSMNLFADITKHLIAPNEVGKLARGVPLIMATYIREGDRYVQRQNTGPYVETFVATVEDKRDPSIIHRYPSSVKYEMQTQAGDCGSPILIASDAFQHKILGFHFAGSEGFGACSIITLPDIEKYVRKLEYSADPKMVTQCVVEEFPLLNSSFRLQGRTITRPIVQPCKTVLRPSLIHGFMGLSQVAPAKLRPALEPEGPMLKGLAKNAGSVRPLDKFLVAGAVESYEEMLSKFTAHGDETRVLTFEESCMGIQGNKYFPPLKRSKSAGYPLMLEAEKGKTDWLGNDEWEFDTPKCVELRKMVNEMEEQCRNGIVPECYFVDTLKDEKRTLDKVAEGKTRVFSAAPLAFSILCRKYMLGFVAFLSRTRIGNECAVGTCAYSEDWKWIVEHLKVFGEKSLIAGDFGNFDGTIVADLFLRIVDIINNFYADSAQNQKVRRMIWEVISKSGHILYDFVYFFSHGQPSGNPTTACTNSMYNSLAIRYCFGLLGLSLKLFNEKVRVIAYGDDNIIAVCPSIRHVFNPMTLSASFAQIGMKYTSEEKEEQGVEFRSMAEVTFLKRHFVYDPNLDWWFAPLSLQSIIESMNWIKKSPSDIQATLDNCMDAQDELFHHEEEVYEKVKSAVQSALRVHGLRVTWQPWRIGREKIALFQEDSIGENKRYI